MSLTRTERHRNDTVKSGGVVYTPTGLAEFLAQAAFEALGSVGSVRILDPACGDGELLLAAVAEAERRGLEVASVVGYDISESAVAAAGSRLAGYSGVSLHCADFLGTMTGLSEAVTLFEIDDGVEERKFDLVISNPPYVRTQTLGAKAAQALGARFGLTGRVDLYQAFTAAMIEALAPNGAIGLLCSNKFLTNRAGNSMRKLLRSGLDLDELVDLGDTKLFGAAVLPVIVAGRRRHSISSGQPIRFRSVYEVKARQVGKAEVVSCQSVLAALGSGVSGLVDDGERVFLIRDGVLDDSEADDSLPWNPVDAETKARFEILRKAPTRELGQIAKIRVGVKTTADPVFIRGDWAELDFEMRPEDELLRPLLTHHDVKPWLCEAGRQRILYPHVDNSGRAAPVDLAAYPRASNYLESHRERLEGRSYVIEGGRQWFEIWVPQRPALWPLQKVVFPDIADSPRFAIDRSGAIVNGDCYWMVIEDDDLAELVVAVGNSTFCTWFYDSACGNFLYAGRRRFMTQYIERLPIPTPTRELVEQLRELRLLEDFNALDRLIWSAYGLEQRIG